MRSHYFVKKKKKNLGKKRVKDDMPTKAIFISNVFLVTLLNPVDWNLTGFFFFYHDNIFLILIWSLDWGFV